MSQQTIAAYPIKDVNLLLFPSGVISVAFCFRPILSFSGSLLVMFFAFFYANKHPIVFFVNAATKQRLNRQTSHPLRKSEHLKLIVQQLVLVSPLKDLRDFFSRVWQE